MNGFDLATIALIGVEYALGFSVLAANPRRGVNQCFCLLSLCTGSWMLCLQIGFHDSHADQVARLIRLCTVFGTLFPAGYNQLRLAIVHPELPLGQIIWRNRFWLIAAAAVSVLAFTPWYLSGVVMPHDHSLFSIPEPIYGPGFPLWSAYFVFATILVTSLYIRNIPQVRGRSRLDLQFVLGGLLCTFVFGALLTIVLPMALGTSKSTRLVPFCSVGLQALVAYGIATRQMLDVGAFVRRGVAYALLTLFLASLYIAVWTGVDLALHQVGWHHPLLPNVAATLAIALAMGPSRNVLQRFVSQLVGNWHGIDPNRIFPETDAVLRSVTTTPVVLRKFGRLCQRITGTDRVSIYLRHEADFQSEWRSQAVMPEPLPHTSPLIQILARQRRPCYVDSIPYHQPRLEIAAAHQEMIARGASLAIGVYDQERLIGVMLLGEKLSGRIYDEDQQATLQVMVNRLAIALENASLYTRIQESKLNIETLVDQLLSGVLVVDEHQHITVCNREAMRILQFDRNPLGRDIHCLPPSLRQAILITQKTGQPQRDQSITLEGFNTRPVPIRFGCRTFGREGVLSRGTFLIIDDLTQMNKMEAQLRRSDRLSSLGTLSASVAHEIKNPLVAIKTFVQLLPERQQDIAFLNHFTELIGGEVNRIDNIVNQLLSFARVSTPRFQKVKLHEVLDNTLRLMRHDLNRNRIQCARDFAAPKDLLWADQQKIEQVILNLVLNAQDAMPKGGTLTLKTLPSPSDLIFEVHDDGSGLSPETLQKAFDPFFTTKETGTGLGLSIVYGIITEHGGTIELKNRPERGTCVQIKLPLYHESIPA